MTASIYKLNPRVRFTLNQYNPMPTMASVIANHMLQATGVPSAGVSNSGIRAPTWVLRCNTSTATHPWCQVDSDSDGFPEQGDCDDGDATVHIDQSENMDGSGIDYNCDGWSYP